MTEISFRVIWKILLVSCWFFEKERDIVSKSESDSVQFVQGEGHLYSGWMRG